MINSVQKRHSTAMPVSDIHSVFRAQTARHGEAGHRICSLCIAAVLIIRRSTPQSSSAKRQLAETQGPGAASEPSVAETAGQLAAAVAAQLPGDQNASLQQAALRGVSVDSPVEQASAEKAAAAIVTMQAARELVARVLARVEAAAVEDKQ